MRGKVKSPAGRALFTVRYCTKPLGGKALKEVLLLRMSAQKGYMACPDRMCYNKSNTAQ